MHTYVCIMDQATKLFKISCNFLTLCSKYHGSLSKLLSRLLLKQSSNITLEMILHDYSIKVATIEQPTSLVIF